MPTTPSAKPLDLSAATVHFNRPVPVLVEDALRREIGVLAHNGALVAYTGKYTGRTPKDKHVVRDANSEPHVWWENNQAMSPEEFDGLVQLAQEKLAGRTN